MKNGIALIQILIFSAILSMLGLFFLSTSKNHIKLAQLTNDRTSAFVELYGQQNALFYELLTQEKELTGLNYQGKRLNFHGEVTELSNSVKIMLNDLSSLINLRYPNKEILKALLVTKGLSKAEAQQLVDNLSDYQDIDNLTRFGGIEVPPSNLVKRDGPIIYEAELLFLGYSVDVFNTLSANANIYSRGSFNPLNASEELLVSLYGTEIKEVIVELRKKENLSKSEFLKLTGIEEDDEVFVFPSNDLKVTFMSSFGELNLHVTKIVRFNPYVQGREKPIEILSVKE
ncbi:general secretion pathway protein K domain protein [Pseudoalteromonas luteoviolacea B = ATCC 29581]|nr:general secretion pathway protein K domain protein [Pseudoalteromonas luteoviolacea B = ATCC 29581]